MEKVRARHVAEEVYAITGPATQTLFDQTDAQTMRACAAAAARALYAIADDNGLVERKQADDAIREVFEAAADKITKDGPTPWQTVISSVRGAAALAVSVEEG